VPSGRGPLLNGSNRAGLPLKNVWRKARKTYMSSGRWELNVPSTLRLVQWEMNGYDFSFILLIHMYLRHGARAMIEVWKRLEKQHNCIDSHAQVACRLKVSNFKLVFLYCFIQFQFRLNYNTSLNFLSKMRSDMLYFYFSDKSNILIILSQQFRYTISTL